MRKTQEGKKKSKAYWSRLIALILVAALALGTGLFFLLNRKETLKIASRTEIIKLWDEQGITRWYEDEMKIKVKWIDYGTENIYRKVSEDLGREQKELPDAYLGLGLTPGEIGVLAAQYAFLNFEYMLSEAPNLQAIINRDTAHLPEFLLDGAMISMPSFNEQVGEAYPQKAWVNRAWLQKAGLELPTTPEEFLEVLRAFKEQGDGKPPLGAAYAGSPGNMTTLGFLIHAFVTTDYDLSESNYLNLDGGRVYAGVTQPGYRDALKYLSQLYSEGLMDAGVFEQGQNIFMGSGSGDERYGVILAKDLYALFNDADRAAGYEPLPPLDNKGQRSTLARYSGIRLGGYMIPARIAPGRQQLALRFGDAMLSREGTLAVMYGKKGIGWFDADADALAMGADAATWRLAEDGIDNTELYSAFPGEVPYWMDARLQMERQAPQNGASLQTAQNWQGYLYKVTKDCYEPVGRGNIQNILPELIPGEAGALNLREVSEYLTQASRDFVTGKADADAGWDDFVNALDEKGLQDIIRAMQEAYQQRK